MLSSDRFPMPGTARESRPTTMKPYSVVVLGRMNRSLVLAAAGPPYTDASTGYFFDGSKVDG